MIGYIILGLMIFFIIMEVKNAPTIKEKENDEKDKD
jgi:large-conductance mechanosensitive channel